MKSPSCAYTLIFLVCSAVALPLQAQTAKDAAKAKTKAAPAPAAASSSATEKSATEAKAAPADKKAPAATEADGKKAEAEQPAKPDAKPADQPDAKTVKKPAVDPEVEKLKKKAEQERTKKIGQLKFDRRPSVILKVWSTPPEEKKDEEKKPDEKPKEDDAKKPEQPKPAEKELTPEQKKAQEKAQQKAEREKKYAEEMKQFDESLKQLQKDVTLGNWEAVKSFLASLEGKESRAVYGRIISSLQRPPKASGGQNRRNPEQHALDVDDLIALLLMMPEEKEEKEGTDNKPQLPANIPPEIAAQMARQGRPVGGSGGSTVPQFGGLLRLTVNSGHDIEDILNRFRELKQPAGDDQPPQVKSRVLAKVLLGGGYPQHLGEFLPSTEEAIEKNDREALNLLSQYYLALRGKETKSEHLEKAWQATLAALAAGEIKEKDKQEALKRAVDLAPKIKEELGQSWLDESFTSRPERGMEILATIGSAVSTGMQRMAANADFRQKSLELQNTAVTSLLKASPELAEKWKDTLQLLALNWLREAEVSRQFSQSTRRRPYLSRDSYGNYFYRSYETSRQHMNSGGRNIRAVEPAKIIEIIPGEEWTKLIDDSLQPKFMTIIPQLYLKVQEEEEAFPYIERLAAMRPELAKDLVEEFLRVWTTNHDPNQNQRYTSVYMFAWGYNRRASGIPLTRSKQQRNLQELSKWLKRIQALPIEDVDQTLVTRAFMTVHSSAEVYRLESIERIFGSVDNLKAETLASLIQTMRNNLGGLWRMPATQKKAQTNRKQKDIQLEVLRGYESARLILAKAEEKYADSWRIQLARASLDHDANDFKQELERTTDFTKNRSQSFDGFQRAAASYVGEVPELEEEKYTTNVFEIWFYASLGAPDLDKITHEKVPDPRQLPLIREAINSLPGESAKKHMDMFANALFTRMSGVKPEMKFRFLEAGFEIVGDNERAVEARKVFDYYNDLVTEIKLKTTIDGDGTVGHGEPFGVFVDIHHTKDIERESGGFSRYLQNQNRGYYGYNYGRPNQNYREKFEESARKLLDEHFEVLSVTFQSEDVHSKATPTVGWRVTPYAYLLLKARGPEVDTVPPVRLDLDFMDTSGFAVIPVESASIPIDAKPESGSQRPLEKLQITQTLDEREADSGKLKLEIKASAVGLVPPLGNLVDLKPEEFDVVETDDQGVAVSRFDKEGDQTAIVSERNWLLTLQAKPELSRKPEKFRFGDPVVDVEEVTYQRFVDADLAKVEQQIALEAEYGEPKQSWIWPLVITATSLLIVAAAVVAFAKNRKPAAEAAFRLPDHITPFTVLGLLKNIEQNNGLTSDGKRELGESINRLERYYFVERSGNEPDLEKIAHDWIRSTS